jgi:D-ribose pyranose/furanose isomerase RbsD
VFVPCVPQEFEGYLRPLEDLACSIPVAVASTIQESVVRRETAAERIVERIVIDFQNDFSHLCSEHCRSAHSLDALFESLLFKQLADRHEVRLKVAWGTCGGCGNNVSCWQRALADGSSRLEQSCSDNSIKLKYNGLLAAALSDTIAKLTETANQTIQAYAFLPALIVLTRLHSRLLTVWVRVLNQRKLIAAEAEVKRLVEALEMRQVEGGQLQNALAQAEEQRQEATQRLESELSHLQAKASEVETVLTNAIAAVTELSGPLEKRGHKWTRGWRLRECILEGQALRYYKSADDAVPRGIISLIRTSGVVVKEGGREFEVSFPQRCATPVPFGFLVILCFRCRLWAPLTGVISVSEPRRKKKLRVG